MVKRNMLLIVLSLVFVVSLALLGNAQTTPTSTPPATPKPATIPASEKPQPIVMKVTTDTPATQPLGVALNWFAEEIKKQIPGSEVRVFHAGSLYATADSLEAMRAGTLEACWATSGKATGIFPEFSVFGLPMTVTAEKTFMGLMEGKIGSLVMDLSTKKGYAYLGWGTVSPLIGVAAKTRLLKIEDFKGKKVRAFDKVAHPIMMEKVGAAAVSLAWADFPSSIQSGVVDSGFAGLVSWGGVRQTAPYLTLPGFGGSGINYYFFLVSKPWLEKLPPATQSIIKKVAADACVMEQKLQTKADNDSLSQYQTQDPTKPGAYVMSKAEANVFKALWQEPVAAAIKKEIGARGEEIVKNYIDAANELQKE